MRHHVIATTNAAGVLTSTTQYDPFGNIVGGSSPDNQAGTATNAWVGNNQKLAEEDMSLNPVQMGARVYLAKVGRFLQVDPVEGGTDNNYAYANDPVNDFDLDGNFALRTALKWTAAAANVASFVPGPIGMVASGVAAASYAAQGNWAAAAISAAGFIPGGKIASSLALKSATGTRVLKVAVAVQARSKGIGAKSRLLGSTALGAKKAGALNRPGTLAKAGWSRKQGQTVYRYGLGKKTYYNKLRGKHITVSRWHW